jgi:hypothetical protein
MHSLTVPKILLGLLFMACASTADPLFLYQINYHATSGPIQSFGASFVSQNLLTGSSGAFAFNPFSITDGTNTWVMGQGIATVGIFSRHNFGIPALTRIVGGKKKRRGSDQSDCKLG